MIVQYTTTAILPKGLENASWKRISDTEAEILFTPEQIASYTLSKMQAIRKLREIGKLEAVEQMGEANEYVADWLKYGVSLFRWDEQTIQLAEALEIDLDAFYEQ